MKSVSLYAKLAIAGQIFLVASSFLLSSVSQYNVISDRISELALGRFGFIETSAFFVSGCATFALAFAIRKLTKSSPGSFIGSLLIGIYGVGGVVVALFPTDRPDVATRTATGAIHVAAAVVSFLCVTAGMFVLTRTFNKDVRWKSFSPWAILCPICAFGLLFMQGNSTFAGLTERLFICAVAIWIILVAHEVGRIVARL